MTPDVIEQNKQDFINICREQISRPGLDKLLEYLEDSDFYTAPSSTLFHLNEEGGLCKHSMNVYHTAIKIYESTILPAILSGNSPFKEEISKESIAIATLFHDLCKTKIYHKSEKWRKDESGRWVSYIGYELKDEFPFGHGEKSCLMIGWFMRLKLEELLAIRWHMGMFEMTENGTSTKAAYRVAMDKSPLVSLVQCADMISANCLEITTVIK
jgi:hypothetical protein